jgi:hypothetical protein
MSRPECARGVKTTQAAVVKARSDVKKVGSSKFCGEEIIDFS